MKISPDNPDFVKLGEKSVTLHEDLSAFFFPAT